MKFPISENLPRVSIEPLRTMAAEMLRRVGLVEADARFVARCLVSMDLRGIFSHGVQRLGQYVPSFRDGLLNPRPSLRVIRQNAVTAVVDGDGGLGYFAAAKATELAIEKALAQGVAVCSSRYHGHDGALGIYARMALEKNLVSICVSGGSRWKRTENPEATIYRALSSPPMCIAIPGAGGDDLVLDMNTEMFRTSQAVEAGMAASEEAVFKSLGLKFAAQLLGGVVGGFIPQEQRPTAWPAASRGFVIVAIDPASLNDPVTVKAEVARILAGGRTMPPLPGQNEAVTAGQIEARRERAWTTEGIPLPEVFREILQTIAKDLGLDVPW
jgi:LDH2 family malate/lactate/ureidoglycolate dehydrogenase